ncbi:MAG: NUDIX domain-containing protein [Actinomycetota bacterium]|nr:NUDIX domain-containing protein [Actinomycetota bacterium]
MPEPGESYARAADREVMEEVGMTIDPAALREVVRVVDDA